MKIAPLVSEFQKHKSFQQKLIHTGQHYDEKLSKVFFEDLEIPRPDLDLGIGSGTREEQISGIMSAFRKVTEVEKPDLVLVVGDVNSTVACARVAKEQNIKVAHVEAGLRSFDQRMPEEHNRVETDKLSDYLFVTEQSGIENLKKEGVRGESVLVGNVMIDTLVKNLEKAKASKILETLNLNSQEYLAATFHRPSNVDEKKDLKNLISIIQVVTEKIPLVLPLHPRTQSSLARHNLLEPFKKIEGLVLTEPLGYLDFLRLVQESQAVLTDSGGIQEETTYLRIPCVTMRENTERPVTIEIGTNVLAHQDQELVLFHIEKILRGEFNRGELPPYWDGKAAFRIVEYLEARL